MATLKVPAHVPAPSEDAEQLRKAFEGLSLSFLKWIFDPSLFFSLLKSEDAPFYLIHDTLLWIMGFIYFD